MTMYKQLKESTLSKIFSVIWDDQIVEFGYIYLLKQYNNLEKKTE